MCLRVRPLLTNCRGVTGVIFAITTAILVGAAAIATESGLWYLGRQQSYSVADAAAIAGAIADANGSDPTAAATALAAQNGFGNGIQGAIAGALSSTVQVNSPPSTGNYTDTSQYPGATEVLISLDFPTYLASLFHPDDINVASRAVAIVHPVGQACLLSQTGKLTIAMGAMGVAWNLCYFASNATDASAVTILNSGSVFVHGITAVGNIQRTDCASGNCVPVSPLWGSTDMSQGYRYDRPDAAYQLPTTDPYAGIPRSVTYPTSDQIVCPVPTATWTLTYTGSVQPDPQTHCPPSMADVTISGQVPPTQPDPAQSTVTSACATLGSNVCAFYNMNITISSSATLQPGTYLLLNSSLKVQAGATVTCSLPNYQNVNLCGSPDLAASGNGIPGVTIVLAGVGSAPVGSGMIYVDPGASVTLTAASGSAYSSALNGVLLFRDQAALPADSADSPAVIIADGLTNTAGPSFLQGIMYFPGANVWFGANVSVNPGDNQPLCDVIVAGTLNIGYQSNPGSASNYANFASGGCPAAPVVRAPALVE